MNARKIFQLTTFVLSFASVLILPLEIRAEIICTCQQNNYVIPSNQITSCVECPGKCASRGGELPPCTDTGGSPGGGSPAGPPAQYSLDTVDPLKPASGGNVETLAINAIRYVLGFVGVGVFAAFLYGGALMIFSAGNPKRVGAGKNAMVYAVIGLAVIFFSYAILNFFFNILAAGAG